jgi:ferric-dicitrate binding protein FerR (iron transport regulator)
MKNDRIWELMARKMSGELSSGELDELEQILRDNPHLHFSVQAFSDLWRHSSTSPTPPEAIEAYARHLQKMKQLGFDITTAGTVKDDESVLIEGSRKIPMKRYIWLAAATLIAVIAGGWYFFSSQSGNTVIASAPPAKEVNNSEVSTKYGSKTRIQLPDGSQVWLNAGSKLNYTNEFGKTIREVQLIGEGFFDVVKNVDKPFIIHTASIDIKVLGTQFNVKSYPGDKTSETSLVRGSVEVVVHKRPDQKYVLKPNEKIVVLNDDLISSSPSPQSVVIKTKEVKEPIIAIKNLTYKKGDSVSVETAWAYNKLSFEDESFVEVAKKMERWYDVEFVFRNSKMEDIRLQGSFIRETLAQAMEALKYTNRFKYEIDGKKVTIY